MANAGLTMTVEMEAIHYAFDILQSVHAQLATKHGERFRALDRKIDRLLDNWRGTVDVQWIGGGRLVAYPAGQFADALREARALGLSA